MCAIATMTSTANFCLAVIADREDDEVVHGPETAELTTFEQVPNKYG
jgi:hypothetical protein